MAKARTAKQKAALRKAQLASARKRKRGALARNVGRGVIGSKRGSRKGRYRLARVAGGAVALGAAAGAVYAANKYARKRSVASKSYKTTSRAQKIPKVKYNTANSKSRAKANQLKRDAFMSSTRPRTASGSPNRYNRVFVTTSRGTTSVRKRGR